MQVARSPPKLLSLSAIHALLIPTNSKLPPARGKIPAKVAVAKARTSRATHRRTNSKVVAEKADVQRKTAPQVAAGESLDTRRIAAQFEKFRET